MGNGRRQRTMDAPCEDSGGPITVLCGDQSYRKTPPNPEAGLCKPADCGASELPP
jgi:hypothetical protein